MAINTMQIVNLPLSYASHFVALDQFAMALGHMILPRR